MHSRFGTAALAAILAAGTLALAARAMADELGFYTKLSAIGSVGLFDDVANTSTGTFAGLAVAEGEERDLVAGPAAALGYWWGSHLGIPVRTEVEYVLRYRFDYDASPVAFTSGTPEGVNSNVQTHSVLLNAFFDVDTGTRLLPYIGGGVGYARSEADTKYTNKATGFRESGDTATNNFAWSANAGFLVQMTSDWGVEFGYRYVDLGEVDMGRAPSGVALEADSYTSHDILIGLLYRL